MKSGTDPAKRYVNSAWPGTLTPPLPDPDRLTMSPCVAAWKEEEEEEGGGGVGGQIVEKEQRAKPAV